MCGFTRPDGAPVIDLASVVFAGLNPLQTGAEH